MYARSLGAEMRRSMRKEYPVRIYAAKGLAGFMAAILFFSVISRVTASFTVAVVVAEYPSMKRIGHVVYADGIVEKNREIAIMTEPGILVKTVYAAEGQKVSAGELLAELDLNQLAEVIRLEEEQLQILRLQKNSAQEAESKSRQEAARARKREKEDAAQKVADTQADLEKAAENLQSAKDAYYSYEQAISGGTQDEGAYGQLLSLQSALKAAQDAYDAALRGRNEAEKEAGRAMEDADTSPAKDYSAEISSIEIGQKERELKKLKNIQSAGGKITSPADGVVTKITAEPGQKTADTADLTSGMRYVAQIGKEDAKYVTAGSGATLMKNGNEIGGITIDTVQTLGDGTMEVTAVLMDTSLSIGDAATLELRVEQKDMSLAVPQSALRQDDRSWFVYVLEVKDTVLGELYFVRRQEVDVTDKNGTYAALAQGFISTETQIITDSDRYIEAGSRVRLQGS